MKSVSYDEKREDNNNGAGEWRGGGLLAAAVFAAKYTSGVLRVRILKSMVSTAVVKRDRGGNVVSEKKVILVKTYKVPGKEVLRVDFGR